MGKRKQTPARATTIRRIVTVPVRVRLSWDDNPGAERHAMARLREYFREGGGCTGFGEHYYDIRVLGPASAGAPRGAPEEDA